MTQHKRCVRLTAWHSYIPRGLRRELDAQELVLHAALGDGASHPKHDPACITHPMFFAADAV
jgi:hypothetical protein